MPNTMLRTSSGTIYFDALLHADHNSSVTPTTHPVQVGAAISDHAIVQPKEISLEVGMTDVIGGDGSSVRAYQQFLAIMQKREPVTVVTRLSTYQNMLLTSIAAPDDYTTMNSLKCTLIFTEVRIVSAATVQIQQTVSASKSPAQTETSTTPQQTTPSTTPKTDKSSATEKQSVLSQITKAQDQKQKKDDAKSTAAVRANALTIGKNTAKDTIAQMNALVDAKVSTTKTTSKATVKPAAATTAKAQLLTSKNKNLTVALLN